MVDSLTLNSQSRRLKFKINKEALLLRAFSVLQGISNINELKNQRNIPLD